jgi:hypothetical protein
VRVRVRLVPRPPQVQVRVQGQVQQYPLLQKLAQPRLPRCLARCRVVFPRLR